MKKLLIILIVFVSFFSTKLYSQQGLPFFLEKKNTVDVTLGGGGIFVSVNYSRIVFVESKYFLCASVGIGTAPFIGGSTYPHQLSINFGKKRDFLELGLGGSYWIGKTNASGYTITDFSYNLMPSIGYRRNFSNNFVFKIYGTAFINLAGVYVFEDYPVVPFGGLSFGYSF